MNFKKNSIVYGTLLLSFSGLVCRGIGFLYHLFIARTFGEEAMGVFQLISPILILAFSLTCAGFQTAISKFTASCLGQNKNQEANLYLLCGCFLGIIISLSYSCIIFNYAETIAVSLLKERKCAILLKICAISFPFSAFHSCLNGYFYAIKNTKIPSFTQIIEQLVRVGCVLIIYNYFLSKNKIPSIAITCIGMVLGELISCIISFISYLITYHNLSNSRNLPSSHSSITIASKTKICKNILTFSFPLIINRVLVNILQSYETISLPAALKNYGYSSKTALSIYGVLSGMALNLILFPSTFTNSFSVLLLPTISEAHSKDHVSDLKTTIRKTIFFILILGFSCTFCFFSFGTILGEFLFQSTLAGRFIRILSFLCPFLYLRTTLFSILNGLQKTKITLWINLFSICLRLITILFFVPNVGIYGYLYGLLLSEIISSIFCILFLKNFL
ncbi:MAG: oligosaccharide flippase family protein [Lachnospiraceae bacterium]|nr:oligosaccharide flippase family protein [Lachnospiraceae bacterium]